MRRILCTLFGLALAAGCTQQLAGTSDDTSTGTRIATVLNPDRTPASGASVRIFSSGDTSRVPVVTISADQRGLYSFDAKRGYYSFWVESDSLVAFEDSVLIVPQTKESTTTVLSQSVIIEGSIRMQPGDDARSTYVGVLGTYKYANMDQQGRFRIAGVAPGTYTLRFVSTVPEYTPTFLSVNVVGDSAVQFVGSVEMVYTGIPSVRGIVATYDSVSGLARVSWQASSYPYIDRYVIYRGLASQPQNTALQIGMAEDTVFVDSTVVSSLYGAAETRFRYSVAILNETGTMGRQFLSSTIDAYNPVNNLKLLSPRDLESFAPGSDVVLTWALVRGAAGYQIQVDSEKGFATPADKSTDDTTTLIQNLATGSHFWRLRAKSVSGAWGPWSPVLQFGLGVFTRKVADVAESDGAVAMSGLGSGVIMAIPEAATQRTRISHFDSLGNLKWSRAILLGDGKKVSHVSISTTPDGAILCVNASSTSTSVFDESAIVIGLDASGTEVWRRQFDGWSSSPTVSQTGVTIGMGFVDQIASQGWQSQGVLLKGDGTPVWSRQLGPSFSDPPVVIPKDDSSAIVGYCSDSSLQRSLVLSRMSKAGEAQVLYKSQPGIMPIRPLRGWFEDDGAAYLAASPYVNGGILEIHRIASSGEVTMPVRKVSHEVASVDRSATNATFIVSREARNLHLCFYADQLTEQGCTIVSGMQDGVRVVGALRGDGNAMIALEGAIHVQGTRPLYLAGFARDQRFPMIPSTLLE